MTTPEEGVRGIHPPGRVEGRFQVWRGTIGKGPFILVAECPTYEAASHALRLARLDGSPAWLHVPGEPHYPQAPQECLARMGSRTCRKPHGHDGPHRDPLHETHWSR